MNVTPAQDTPTSNRVNGKFINFDTDVEIQKPIEKLPRGKSCCIFYFGIPCVYWALCQKKHCQRENSLKKKGENSTNHSSIRFQKRKFDSFLTNSLSTKPVQFVDLKLKALFRPNFFF